MQKFALTAKISTKVVGGLLFCANKYFTAKRFDEVIAKI